MQFIDQFESICKVLAGDTQTSVQDSYDICKVNHRR